MIVIVGLVAASCGPSADPSSATAVDETPRIDPDYSSLVIPPNIAPMRFRIEEEGADYLVRISSEATSPFDLHCPDGTCRIGPRRWRALLEENRGKGIDYDVYVKREDGRWARFRRFTNIVAEEPIDAYIAFRLLVPNFAGH